MVSICCFVILQARTLEWVAIPFSRGSSQLRDHTRSPALQVDSLSSESPGKSTKRSWRSATQKRIFTRTQSCWYTDLRLQASKTIRNTLLLFLSANFIEFCCSSLNRLGKPMLLVNLIRWTKFRPCSVHFSSVTQSCQTLRPHGLQHTRLPCPSVTPGACPNSYPSSLWCHLTISSCHPLLLLPSTFPSIKDFSNESVLCIRWPKYWSFWTSSEYSGLISFKIDWFDLLEIQGTLKGLF